MGRLYHPAHQSCLSMLALTVAVMIFFQHTGILTDTFLIHHLPNHIKSAAKTWLKSRFRDSLWYRNPAATWYNNCPLWCGVTVARQAVRNLRLSDETTQSFEASWELDDPHVESYRVTYSGFSGDHEEESVSRSSCELLPRRQHHSRIIKYSFFLD